MNRYIRDNLPEIVLIGAVALFVAMFAGAVFASDKQTAPTTTQAQAQSQQQSTASTSAASNDLTVGGDRSLALFNGSVAAPSCPQGLVPGRRLKRAIASPLYSASAVCVPPSEAEAAAMQVQRDHELRLAELAAGLERERLAIERDRLKLESQRLSLCHECEVQK